MDFKRKESVSTTKYSDNPSPNMNTLADKWIQNEEAVIKHLGVSAVDKPMGMRPPWVFRVCQAVLDELDTVDEMRPIMCKLGRLVKEGIIMRIFASTIHLNHVSPNAVFEQYRENCTKSSDAQFLKSILNDYIAKAGSNKILEIGATTQSKQTNSESQNESVHSYSERDEVNSNEDVILDVEIEKAIIEMQQHILKEFNLQTNEYTLFKQCVRFHIQKIICPTNENSANDIIEEFKHKSSLSIKDFMMKVVNDSATKKERMLIRERLNNQSYNAINIASDNILCQLIQRVNIPMMSPSVYSKIKQEIQIRMQVLNEGEILITNSEEFVDNYRRKYKLSSDIVLYEETNEQHMKGCLNNTINTSNIYNSINAVCDMVIQVLKLKASLKYIPTKIYHILSQEIKSKITKTISNRNVKTTEEIHAIYRQNYPVQSDISLLANLHQSQSNNANAFTIPEITNEELKTALTVKYNKKKFLTKANQMLIEKILDNKNFEIENTGALVKMRFELRLRMEMIAANFSDSDWDCNDVKKMEKLLTKYRKQYDLSSDIHTLECIVKELKEKDRANLELEEPQELKKTIDYKITRTYELIELEIKRNLSSRAEKLKPCDFNLFEERVRSVLWSFEKYNLGWWTDYYKLYRLKFNVSDDVSAVMETHFLSKVISTAETKYDCVFDTNSAIIPLENSHIRNTTEAEISRDLQKSGNTIMSDVSYYLTRSMEFKYQEMLHKSLKQYIKVVQSRIKLIAENETVLSFHHIYTKYLGKHNVIDDLSMCHEIMNKLINQDNTTIDTKPVEIIDSSDMPDLNSISPEKIAENEIVLSIHRKFPEIYEYHLNVFRILVRNRINEIVKGRQLPQNEVYALYRLEYNIEADIKLLDDVLRSKINWSKVDKYFELASEKQVSKNFNEMKNILGELKCMQLKKSVCEFINRSIDSALTSTLTNKNSEEEVSSINSTKANISKDRVLDKSNKTSECRTETNENSRKRLKTKDTEVSKNIIIVIEDDENEVRTPEMNVLTSKFADINAKFASTQRDRDLRLASYEDHPIDEYVKVIMIKHIEDISPLLKTKLKEIIEKNDFFLPEEFSNIEDRRIVGLCGQPKLPGKKEIRTFLSKHKPLSTWKNGENSMVFAEFSSLERASPLLDKSVVRIGDEMLLTTLIDRQLFEGLKPNLKEISSRSDQDAASEQTDASHRDRFVNSGERWDFKKRLTELKEIRFKKYAKKRKLEIGEPSSSSYSDTGSKTSYRRDNYKPRSYEATPRRDYDTREHRVEDIDEYDEEFQIPVNNFDKMYNNYDSKY